MAIYSMDYCCSLLNENYHLINPFKLKGKMLLSSRDTRFSDVDDDKIWMAIHLVERDWDKIVDFTANAYLNCIISFSDFHRLSPQLRLSLQLSFSQTSTLPG